MTQRAFAVLVKSEDPGNIDETNDKVVQLAECWDGKL